MVRDEFIIDIDKLVESANPFWVGMMSGQLSILSKLMEEAQSKQPFPLFWKIAEWEGERTTDHYDDLGYCRLCSEMWEHLGGQDCGSSHGMHANWKFVSDSVQAIYKHNKDIAIKRRKERIIKLKEELDELEKEDSCHAD